MGLETWRPLLEGEPAGRAWQAIRAIAGEIEKKTFAPRTYTPDAWSLAGGAAGIALFYAYLAEATGEPAFEDRAVADLEDALEGAAAQPFHLGLWQGLLGVTFTFDHLAGRLFEREDAEDGGETAAEGEAADPDSLLQRRLAGEEEHYDLIQGLAGYGIACLEGLPRKSARASLDRVLDHLLATAEPQETGCSWFTPPHLLPEWQAKLAPEGYYNLGVAHGVPAVIVLLARCLEAGIRRPEVGPLLDGAVAWLLAQRGEEGFPSWVPKGRPAQKAARLAWCYGDPGIAATLLVAARATGNHLWHDAAIDVACVAAARDLSLSGVQDSGICHGAAGLAHIFNRLYQASGRPELAEAARHWFGEVLAMRREEGGVGGFKIWSTPRTDPFAQLDWIDDPGLLTGSAGIGLCLLAAVTAQHPQWDRLLLLSGSEGEAGEAARVAFGSD